MLAALLLSLSLPAAAADRLAAALDKSTATTVFDYAVLYQSCRAYAADEPEQCAALRPYPILTRYNDAAGKKALERPGTYDFLCRSSVLDLRMSAAAIRGEPEKLVRACEDHVAAGHDDFLPGKARQGCAILGRLARDPAQACAQTRPLMRERARGFCESELNVFNGRPDACGQPGLGPVGQELCRANAAYRRAVLARDPSLCGDSALCRAHAGAGPGACAPYLEHAERLACARRGSAAACGRSPLDRARLARADELLKQAGGILDQLERGACGPGFSVETLRRTFSQKLLPEGLADALFQSAAPDLENYYQCRAIVGRSDAVCADLKAFGVVVQREALAEPLPMDLMCRTLFYEARLAQELIASERDKVRSLCVTRNKVGDRDFKLDSLETSCGILSGFAGDTAATCGRLKPYFDNATIAASCPRMMRYAAGDPAICPDFHDPLVHERCLGYAAFKESRSAGPQACGGSNYCRTLRGEADTCKVYEKRMGEAYCRFYDQAAPRLPALLSEIETLLGESDPEGATGSRGASLAALRRRLGARRVSRAP